MALVRLGSRLRGVHAVDEALLEDAILRQLVACELGNGTSVAEDDDPVAQMTEVLVLRCWR